MKLCLTIGVSKAPPLSYLPGAITAAHEMGDWARQAGFTTEVITDEGETRVTIQRIRESLKEMLASNDEVELFVLHFAGHGFRSGAEQNMWLPSDWFDETRAISVEGLKRQLYRHGIRSLTIFGDACRSLPADIDTADIFGDPVLPRGPYEAQAPIIDRFNAVVDGQQAYMLKGDGKAPDRCVFSTVLIEGLCGFRDEAFDKYLPDCVIPESLALFSKDRLREIGEIYDLQCKPDCATGIPREHAVYFQRGGSPHGLPPPKWPAPPEVVQEPDGGGREPQFRLPGIKEFSRPLQARLLTRHIRDGLSIQRKADVRDFNLSIRGAVPKAIWSTSSVEKCLMEDGVTHYRVSSKNQGAIQILVEFEDGVFASAVVYPMLVTFLVRDGRNEINWTCVSRWDWGPDPLSTYIETIVDLQAGNLAADQVDDIAARLRSAKHVNPTLGAIASYLYDYSGDIDSIRRMAFFYCDYGQAIPFDVAFMGLLQSTDSGHGSLVTEVPPVRERPYSTANQKLPGWVTSATHPVEGEIAGLWPWLRQGWQFMENPEPEEKAVAENLGDVAAFLLPSQFSSFKAEGARILVQKFNLEESR
ncbi:caspase family protein [Pseudomonas aeruginosa]